MKNLKALLQLIEETNGEFNTSDHAELMYLLGGAKGEMERLEVAYYEAVGSSCPPIEVTKEFPHKPDGTCELSCGDCWERYISGDNP